MNSLRPILLRSCAALVVALASSCGTGTELATVGPGSDDATGGSTGGGTDTGGSSGGPGGSTGPGTPGGQASAHAPAATVVLLHGMGGFTRIGVDYFFGVPEAWRRAGARVVVPGTSALASIEQRAAQLKVQLDSVPGPLILVGHSQGGLDARYLVSKLGYAARTRAVVTLASPHHGSPVADVALGLTPDPVEAAADTLLSVLGWSLDGAREVTVAYMDGTFNRTVPDAPGVIYWSWSGRAAPLGLGRGNGWLHTPLLATWTLLDRRHEVSDGIVPEASAHWGVFQGVMKADHIGEVGQPLGETPGFDHADFFRVLLQRFHDQGW